MEENQLESVKLRMRLAEEKLNVARHLLAGEHYNTDPKYGRTLAIAKRLREECDYDEHKRATKEEAQTAIADAEGFVRETQKLLRQLLARQGE